MYLGFHHRTLRLHPPTTLGSLDSGRTSYIVLGKRLFFKKDVTINKKESSLMSLVNNKRLKILKTTFQ